MNPHQKNKVDINSLSADEQRLFRLYGKLPNKKDLLQNKLKERKYFDSGDYALSKAGKAGDTGVTAIGTEHPSAEDIPHKMHPLTNTLSRGDSVSSASPPNTGPLGNTGSIGNTDGTNAPTLSSTSPAGMHRGSINGIPGGGLPGVQGISRSPNKETSHLARSASLDEDNDDAETEAANLEGNISPPPKVEGIPIRR